MEKNLYSKEELSKLGLDLDDSRDVHIFNSLTGFMGYSLRPVTMDDLLSSHREISEEIAIDAEDVEEDEPSAHDDEVEIEEIEEESGDEKQTKPPPTPPPPKPPAIPTVEKKPPPMPVKKESGWSDNFFDDEYLLTMKSPSRVITELEVDFLMKELALESGKKVLDIACGDGRHAIALASKGCDVTGIDTSVPFLLQASQVAKELNTTVNFIKKDMRDFVSQTQFDALYCIGGSFGYFTDAENNEIVRLLNRNLKPGGRAIIHAVNRDFAVSVLPSRIWWEGNGCMVMDESYFIHDESRVQIKRNTAFMNGRQRNHKILVRAWSLGELKSLVTSCGFEVKTVSGSFLTESIFLGSHSPGILLSMVKTGEL